METTESPKYFIIGKFKANKLVGVLHYQKEEYFWGDHKLFGSTIKTYSSIMEAQCYILTDLSLEAEFLNGDYIVTVCELDVSIDEGLSGIMELVPHEPSYFKQYAIILYNVAGNSFAYNFDDDRINRVSPDHEFMIRSNVDKIFYHPMEALRELADISLNGSQRLVRYGYRDASVCRVSIKGVDVFKAISK